MREAYTAKDLTFVIPACGVSPYLEACVRSVLKQSVRGNVLIATASENDWIRAVAKKYDIPVSVRKDGGTGIAADWNFALSLAKTRLVTLAHQDDVYARNYAKTVLRALNRAKDPLIAFTDYAEIRNGRFVKANTLLYIKRMMLLPLRVRALSRIPFVRHRILSLGSAICCPSVCFVKEKMPSPLFEDGYRTDLDWRAWERLSRFKGDFVYCGRVLLAHRIHTEAETAKAIRENVRTKEDHEMFARFWPMPVANLLAAAYRRAEGMNQKD